MINEMIEAIARLRTIAELFKQNKIIASDTVGVLNEIADLLQSSIIPVKPDDIEGFVAMFKFEKETDVRLAVTANGFEEMKAMWYKDSDRNNCQCRIYLILLPDQETIRLTVNPRMLALDHFLCIDILETKNINTLIQFMHVLNLK